MIKHIVLWKLDDSYSKEEKNTIKKELKSKLMNLEGLISELKSIDVYFNSEDAPEVNYDIMLKTSFLSFSDLDKYQTHPEHLKIGDYNKSKKLQRSSIDYHIED